MYLQKSLKSEKEFDDDTESIITNERYIYISSIINDVLRKEEQKAVIGF